MLVWLAEQDIEGGRADEHLRGIKLEKRAAAGGGQGAPGHGARPMDPDWVRLIRDQCQKAKTPFLMKQWGNWKPHSGKQEVAPDTVIDMPVPATRGARAAIKNEGRTFEFWGAGSTWMRKVSKKEAGRELDGRIWDQYPQL